MKTLIVVGVLSCCAGCSSTPSLPESHLGPAPAVAPAGEDGIRVLTAYPTTEYENLGIVEFNFSRPGVRTPSLSDVMPELKTKVLNAGGNAFIIRHRHRDENRSLHVEAEVLKLK
jgi:hypothetical protein